jgi:hypothetical protein
MGFGTSIISSPQREPPIGRARLLEGFRGEPDCLVISAYTTTARPDGQPAVGNGDSRGPVYMPVKGGVKVGGIIAALFPNTAAYDCIGYPASASRNCSGDFYFSPVVRFTTDNSGWTVMTR